MTSKCPALPTFRIKSHAQGQDEEEGSLWYCNHVFTPPGNNQRLPTEGSESIHACITLVFHTPH